MFTLIFIYILVSYYPSDVIIIIIMSSYNPLCAYNKPANHVCFNPDCKVSCFICDGYNKCQCKILHQQCEKLDWVYIKKKLNRDIVKNTPEFKSFSSTVEQLYQNTIKYFTKAYNQFKTWRDRFGLTEIQEQFLALIEEGKFTGLTGQKIYHIRNQIKAPSKIIIKSQGQIKQQIDLIHTHSQTLITQLKELYNQNKITKEIKTEKITEFQKYKSDQYRQIQDSLTNKILGLNQNGTRLLKMMNEGVLEKQLQMMNQSIHKHEKIHQQLKKQIEDVQKPFQIKKKFNFLRNLLNNRKSQLIQNYHNEKSICSFCKSSQHSFKNSISNIEQELQRKLNDLINEFEKDNFSGEKVMFELSKLEQEIKINDPKLSFSETKHIKIEDIKIKTISNFFTKKLKSMNLLYRASQNNFQVSRFWDKCNGKTNTVTILKTQFGKIIGGFTPLAWDKSISGYKQDITRQTFLFSITQNHKIPQLKGSGNTVYHGIMYGPVFGSGQSDLIICDKANITENSYGVIGRTYNNGEYTYGSQQSYMKWSGQSNGSKFLIHQWEVYEITLE